MTVTREAPARHETEALFPEARRRRRHIRLTAGVIVLVVAVFIAGLVGLTAEGGGPPRATALPPASLAPRELLPADAIHKTQAADPGRELWRYVDSYPGCNPIETGSGVLNLSSQRSAVTVSESGCLPGGGNPEDAKYRIIQIGSTSYRTRQPHELGDFPTGKTWLQTNGDVPWLATAEPLKVLNALTAPLKRVGPAYIDGVATMEYSSTTSLASIIAATGSIDSGPIGPSNPPTTRIPIQVHAWVDAQGRLRQLSTWQPRYTQYYTDGYSQGGAYITPWPPHKPAGPPREQGYDMTTLRMWSFGTPAHIAPPPARTVTKPH